MSIAIEVEANPALTQSDTCAFARTIDGHDTRSITEATDHITTMYLVFYPFHE